MRRAQRSRPMNVRRANMGKSSAFSLAWRMSSCETIDKVIGYPPKLKGVVRSMFLTRIKYAVPAALIVLLALGSVRLQLQAKAPDVDQAALIKRGDYLVNQVARCGDCHTPRNARGK